MCSYNLILRIGSEMSIYFGEFNFGNILFIFRFKKCSFIIFLTKIFFQKHHKQLNVMHHRDFAFQRIYKSV